MTNRLDRQEFYMQVARTAALRGTCPRKQVGAVIVKDKRIIGMGYNGAPPGMAHCTDVGCGGGIERETVASFDPETGKHFPEFPNGCTRAIHAELNAIAFSARHGVATDGASMYSTVSTCVPCAQALIAAGIRAFFYDEEYRIKDGIDLLTEAGVEVRQWTR